MKTIFFLLSFTIAAICVINTGKAIAKRVQHFESLQAKYASRLDAALNAAIE